MMKTKLEKTVVIGGISLLLFGFLMCCSGIQFPFFNAKSSLNRHLDNDFGVSLPASSVVDEAYWVGSRDPEHVFKIQIAPADMTPFIDKLRAAAKMRNITEKSEEKISRFGPLYRTPPWWNNPALADPIALEFTIPVSNTNPGGSHYRFLYSPTTGILYAVWGSF